MNTSPPSRNCGPRTSRSSRASTSKFDKITFAPKPAQKGGIPIWVGGESGPALRRTAKYGDAWYPIPNNPAFPMDSLKRLTAGIARLRQLTAEAGRDPKAVGVTVRFQRYGDGLPDKADDGERKLFTGSAGRHRRRHQGAGGAGRRCHRHRLRRQRPCPRSWPR